MKNHKKLWIASAVAALLLVILCICAVGCQHREAPDETTPSTSEVKPVPTKKPTPTKPKPAKPTEPKPTDPTEPKPTEPPATEVPAQEPVKPQPEHNDPKPATPPAAETKPTEPPAAELKPTDPPATEPPMTEPPKPVHQWQRIDHEEEGHYISGCECVCGARFKTSDEWSNHLNSFSLSDQVKYHGSNHSYDEWIVDKPAYTEWVCTICGEVRTTEP